jgi:hypothetical protein
MGWQSRPGFGLCLTGTDNRCPKVYDNVGLDFMYGLLYGDFHLSLHSSLFLLPIADPTGVMWTIGVTGKFHFADAVALFFDPQVGVMLANRDVTQRSTVHPRRTCVPGHGCDLAEGLVGGDRSAVRTGRHVSGPAGLGAVGNLSRHLDLGLRFSFDNLRGNVPPGASRTDARSIGLLVTVRTCLIDRLTAKRHAAPRVGSATAAGRSFSDEPRRPASRLGRQRRWYL